jgi:TetR/AcrR family transcriptional repressor of nem operon
MNSVNDRRQDILQHASSLLRTRGFNAFSHRDLAERTGVKSSSIHYYFPTKQDVGIALIQQYREDLAMTLQSLNNLPVSDRLANFVAPFVETAQTGHQWCLAGMLASDFNSLDEPLRIEVRRFFDLAEHWLADQALSLQPELSPDDARVRAQSAMALLEGALLLARAQQDAQRMHNALTLFYALLGASPAKA